ncbi:MAG: glycine zipper domain-containing protein [Gammaproteobacteria bacterium]|nr:glycine zipper domain-containing protein [Gammaproteobacteria bacterium]
MLTARFLKPLLLIGVLWPALALAVTSYDRAEVVAVVPLYETVSYEVGREQCHIQRVEYRRDPGRGSATGPILGAIIGGALGNAVGHHKHNKQVGTVVGAILGASVGADISRRNRRNSGYVSYADEEVCHVVNEIREEEQLLGYRVTYRYAGQTYVTRMDRDPGRSLRVRVRVTPA